MNMLLQQPQQTKSTETENKGQKQTGKYWCQEQISHTSQGQAKSKTLGILPRYTQAGKGDDMDDIHSVRGQEYLFNI